MRAFFPSTPIPVFSRGGVWAVAWVSMGMRTEEEEEEKGGVDAKAPVCGGEEGRKEVCDRDPGDDDEFLIRSGASPP